jgi:hypothetical protein
MSTSITTVFNNLVTFMGDQLTAHKRLNDPYSLEANPEMLLRKGWGIQIDDGSDTGRCISPEYYLARNFTLIVVRETVGKDSDPARRENAMLELLEDLHILIAEAVSENTLYQSAVNFKYVSDSGVQEVFVQEKPYNFVEAVFTVEYSQNITGA